MQQWGKKIKGIEHSDKAISSGVCIFAGAQYLTGSVHSTESHLKRM